MRYSFLGRRPLVNAELIKISQCKKNKQRTNIYISSLNINLVEPASSEYTDILGSKDLRTTFIWFFFVCWWGGADEDWRVHTRKKNFCWNRKRNVEKTSNSTTMNWIFISTAVVVKVNALQLGRASLNPPDLAQSGVSGLRGRVILETFEPSLGGSSWPDPAVILSCIHDEQWKMLVWWHDMKW